MQFAEDWAQLLIDSKVREYEGRIGGMYYIYFPCMLFLTIQSGPGPYLPFPPSGMLPPPFPMHGAWKERQDAERALINYLSDIPSEPFSEVSV